MMGAHPKPPISSPKALRDWFRGVDIGRMPFAAIEGARRQAAATPEEVFVVALCRYRIATRDPKAKLRVITRRMGQYTTMHIIAATPHRTVRAKTLMGAIRKAAFGLWSTAPNYLKPILDAGYERHRSAK